MCDKRGDVPSAAESECEKSQVLAESNKRFPSFRESRLLRRDNVFDFCCPDRDLNTV